MLASVAQLDLGILNIAVSVVIPLLVALVTKHLATSRFKAIINLVLAGAATQLQVAIESNGQVELREWLGTLAVTWVISIVSYYGLWNPSGAANFIAFHTRNFGVGKEYLPYDIEKLLAAINSADDVAGVDIGKIEP